MRTTRIIHTRGISEGATTAAWMMILIPAAIIYSLMRGWDYMTTEGAMPLTQLDYVTLEEPFDPTAIGNGYSFKVRIKNNSDRNLKSMDYVATMRVCQSDMDTIVDCPVLARKEGSIEPGIDPGITGIFSQEGKFEGNIPQVDGQVSVHIEWTGATGDTDLNSGR